MITDEQEKHLQEILATEHIGLDPLCLWCFKGEWHITSFGDDDGFAESDSLGGVIKAAQKSLDQRGVKGTPRGDIQIHLREKDFTDEDIEKFMDMVDRVVSEEAR